MEFLGEMGRDGGPEDGAEGHSAIIFLSTHTRSRCCAGRGSLHRWRGV